MTLHRARQLLAEQVQFQSGYNRNAVRLILAEVARWHGQSAVDELIRQFDLEKRFDLRPGTDFSHLRSI